MERIVRLIPAHAGKTNLAAWDITDTSAHPRSRGENHKAPNSFTDYQGSSPLTRGKPDGAVSVGEAERLIPAHAGKTRNDRYPKHSHPAHPRSRGENRVIWVDSVPTAGSSPLTRGKRRYRHELADHERLIPAHAGKTPYVMTGVKRVRAHPRSRGENYIGVRVGQ